MGCSGSSSDVGSYNSLLTNKKPSVWFIGGGPGCEKGKICDYLIRDYKFKYLSSYDMVQFEQQRGGPDAELIMQLFKDKKKMPSDLIVRLVKKAIASCGVRRFLIDGFPNSVQDVSEFDKQLTQREIDFYGYLYIEISEKKMIESGIQANSSDKKKSKAQIEDNVKEIVQAYLKQSKQIKEVYIRNKKYHQINGQEGADKCYEQVKQYFESEGIEPPRPVKVFFSHFDNQVHQIKLCDDFVRKYGLYFYTPKDLIEEAVAKGNSPEGQAIIKLQKDNKQIPPALVLALMRKKIQKHDYRGNFLISGYPRTISDAQQWDKHFGWQTQVLGYITFQIPDENFKKIFNEKMVKYKPSIKQEELTKQFNNYQSNQKQICNYYAQREKLLTVNAEDEKKALSDAHSFFISKRMQAKNTINSKKLIFVSTLNGNGDACTQAAKKRGAVVIDMDALFEHKIKQNGLYSQLIQSFIKIGKPVSGIVAVRTLIVRILSETQSNLILVNGFPSSEQQMQSWQQQIGDAMGLNLIVIYSDNPKYIEQNLQDKIKSQKITAHGKDALALLKQSSSRMSTRLKLSDWRVHQIKPTDSSASIQQAFNIADFR